MAEYHQIHTYDSGNVQFYDSVTFIFGICAKSTYLFNIHAFYYTIVLRQRGGGMTRVAFFNCHPGGMVNISEKTYIFIL